MSEWQDIETAPKDGSAILLAWAIDADGNRIDWRRESSNAGVFVQVANWRQGERDWSVYCGMIFNPTLHFDPTHWMPIPNPPKR